MVDGRGGVRPLAGRKPKILMYGEQALAAEGKMVAALSEIVDKMIEQALAGDVKSQKYVIDRILGRVAKLDAPPAEDRSMPFVSTDFEAGLNRNARKALNAKTHQDAVNEGASAIAEVKSMWNGAVEDASTSAELARALKAERSFPGLGRRR